MPGLISPHTNLGLVGNPPVGSSNLILDLSGNLALIRSNGDIEIISASASVGPTGPSGASGATGPAGSGGGVELYDVTYDQLLHGLTSSNLTASNYRIIDFQTTGYILGGTVGSTYSSDIEPLIVYAASGSCWPNALSETYVKDEILYDPLPSNWVDDLSFSKDGVNIIDGFKGVVYNRKDTDCDVSASYDWRNVEIRRWKMDSSSATAWGAGTWTRGDYTEDSNNVIYYCMETHTTDGLTGTGSYNPNMYYATSSTSDYLIQRNNIKYHWFRLFDKDLYLLPAWQLGTMSGTYSMGMGTYPENPAGTRILELPINLNDYQDFKTFGIHGTTSVKTDLGNISMYYAPEQAKSEFGSIILTNRFESNKETYNLRVEGTNLTVYDNVPVVPPQPLSDNSKFEDNSFTNFNRILVYGDEFFTTGNPDIVASWTENVIRNNHDIFGYSSLNKINSNGLSSTFEECILIDGFSILSFLRECKSMIFTQNCLVSYFQFVDNTAFQTSQSDFMVSVQSCTFDRSENNVLQINLTGYQASLTSNFGPGFEDNRIGPEGVTNTTIGSAFSNNIIHGINECDISANISGLTSSAPNVIRNTVIESDTIAYVDLSASSYLFTSYSKVIYSRPDGTIRLRYYDNLDTIQIVDPTT